MTRARRDYTVFFAVVSLSVCCWSTDILYIPLNRAANWEIDDCTYLRCKLGVTAKETPIERSTVICKRPI